MIVWIVQRFSYVGQQFKLNIQAKPYFNGIYSSIDLLDPSHSMIVQNHIVDEAY